MTDKYTDMEQWKQLQSNVPPSKWGEATSEFNEIVEIPPEMFEFINVLYHSANTGVYPPNNWLKRDGINTDKKSMYGSIFRHVAEAYGGNKVDAESNLDPRLHAAARLLMDYVRDKRGLNP